MKYNVVMLKNSQFTSYIGKNLEHSEACELLEELHDLETCKIGQCVTPVITLWTINKSTNLSSFIVHRLKDVYQYQVEVDYYQEMAGIHNLNPILN